jgi:conjugative relaxase-like TrwC/TraI family protein
MLTISKPLSASQAQTYHAKEFVSPEQSYWRQDGATQGEWHGKLVAKFELAGPVSAEQFARLSQGQDPHNAEQIIQHRVVQEYESANGKTVAPVEHRAGWDATFSAPKSVSLTALVGGDNRVRDAHRAAVNTALDELERYTQARIGGSHPAETTGQFVAAKFEHDTARPVEGYAAPQLHTHTVIFNMTERGDGTARALQPQGLFDSQQFATAVYQSELTYRLRNLGYEIEPGKSGAPEIKGYSQEYLDASSPRSQQIREYLDRNGFHGHESAQIAAHSTRDGKQIRTPAEVMAAHRQLTAAFGSQADRIVAEARTRERSQVNEPTSEQRQTRAAEAVTFARERSFEREAVIDERDIFRDALRRGMSETTYAEVRSTFQARVAGGEFQAVPGQKHDTGQRFTTAEMIRAEHEVLRRMQQGQGRAEPILSIQNAVKHTRRYEHLNDSQRRAGEQILISRNVVQGLQGGAGVGKSSTLRMVREAAEQHGYIVEGFAPTSRAAQQLRDVGISADTLQGFLARSRQPTPERHFYMVDESSLASTTQARDFLRTLNPGDRVLFIGDSRQHQGVDAGKPFQQLVDGGMQTARLDQIVRQKTPELLQAVEYLSRGDTGAGVALLEQQGRVTEISDLRKRVSAIARNYADSPDNTIVVSPDNASRRQINQAVRAELQVRGAVEPDENAFRILVPRTDMRGADRSWAARYQAGDILRYQRGSKDLGIEKQSYAAVVTVQPKNNLLTVEKSDGSRVTYDPARLHGISAYREMERSFAKGDRLSFTAPQRELGVANRDLGTVEHIGNNGSITVRTDHGKTVSFDANHMRHFDHGYAVTSYSSQGLTAERVLINADPNEHKRLVNERFAYVAASRGSHDIQVFTADAAGLASALSRSNDKTSALASQIEGTFHCSNYR